MLNIAIRAILFVLVFNLGGCISSERALIEATQNSDLKQVRKLISKGADVNARDDDGQSSLHHACYLGNFEIVKSLVTNGANVNIEVPKFGLTPLHGATMNGDIKTVKFLIEHNAKLNAKDIKGGTPIFAACWIGKLSVVKYLVEKGAEIDITTNDGATVLHYASQSGNLDLVKFLTSKGLDVNSQADNGATPLHIAVAIGSMDMVEYLLSNRAKINVKMNRDFPFKKCIKAPILSDNDIEEIQIYMDQTPLDIAADMAFIDIWDLLKDRIANEADEQIAEPEPPSPGFAQN
jgi:ankyrin repeat protein